MGVEACGVAIALYSAEGQVFATYDMCSHGKARLSEGYLEELEIECPLHQGTFDIRTGQALKAPCVVPVRSFQTRLEEDDIFVFVED
jgi:nitrite reductase/ring-hydroxylating ferredoxin subunit